LKIDNNKKQMRKVLITGVSSIHGWPIYQKLKELLPKKNILAVGSPKMDFSVEDSVQPLCITDKERLSELALGFHPTHVIHCGGVCDLDVCEARPDWAYGMNVGGARTIMDLFGAECHVTYVSSDLVFAGVDPPPDGYNENHKTNPLSVVGRTYVEAEREVAAYANACIVRVGLPLGGSFTGDKGAVDWIASRFKRGLPVTLFFDEVRSCPSCEEVAEKVLLLVFSGAAGTFHCGGHKRMSLFEIGKQVFDSGSYSVDLLKKASRLDDIGGPPRVGNVALDSIKLETYIQNCSAGLDSL